VVSSPFSAGLDADRCDGCSTCLERCQMDALQWQDDKIALNLDRCIGCGLCVSTCPTGALSLVRKADQDQQAVPQSMIETLRKLQKAREQLNLRRK
jgi:NAD-dependent dihydropyrimidine dehydrogenase PreA subunit